MSLSDGNIRSNDEGEEETDHLKKKQKTNDVQAATKAAQEEQFLRRWFQHDKSRTLHLMKMHGVAMYGYDMNRTNMEFRNNFHLTNERDNLDGKIYDIIFVAGFLQFRPGCAISRTVKNGTLTFVTKHLENDPLEVFAPGTNVLFGKIDIEKSVCSPGNIYRNLDGWESKYQVNDTEFHESPLRAEDPFDDNRSINFNITRYENRETFDFFSWAHVFEITNSGVMDWIPIEYDSRSDMIPVEEEDDETFGADMDLSYHDAGEYVSFIQKKIVQRSNGHDDNWRRESSWLCNHMNLPEDIARKIHSFTMIHPLPNLQWSWQKGDILLQLVMETGGHMWHTDFIARPRPV